MGLFNKVKDKLPNQFSLFQLMAILEMDESELHEARNILNIWANQNKYIRRISKNMYEKIIDK
ncbi:MAG: hypothetical protein ACTSRZ_21320 [Promethearchaeota archaeon]